ncbi:hypothetical protein NOR_00660 [Metarhizium rileyi]|uniref:Uncharacterized protein n=1 Tax=Metarhizium rileyi (strain RCEF 4871) TaxID=1649241 RepID=A0A167KR03_METRR|nr:hypothetical protein NOR_00660 [Metarhizium rileyi RCEF 4871]
MIPGQRMDHSLIIHSIFGEAAQASTVKLCLGSDATPKFQQLQYSGDALDPELPSSDKVAPEVDPSSVELAMDGLDTAVEILGWAESSDTVVLDG